MPIRLTDAFAKNKHVLLEPDCIKDMLWIESRGIPYTKIYTSVKYAEMCCVKETPDEIVHLISLVANARKKKCH